MNVNEYLDRYTVEIAEAAGLSAPDCPVGHSFFLPARHPGERQTKCPWTMSDEEWEASGGVELVFLVTRTEGGWDVKPSTHAIWKESETRGYVASSPVQEHQGG